MLTISAALLPFAARRSPSMRPPRRTFLLVVMVLLLWCGTSVEGEEVTFLMENDRRPWRWGPQLDLEVPDDFTSGTRLLNTSEQWMLLAHVGVPLRIVTDDSQDLLQLLEAVNFMRDDGTGVCPGLMSSYENLYYALHPGEQDLLYGMRRWRAFQRLQAPAAWSLVLQETVGPAVRKAERFLADLVMLDPPGQVTLLFPSQSLDEMPRRVSLADFEVVHRVIYVGRFAVYRLPHLTLDAEAAARRFHVHQLLLSKLQYQARIIEYDEAAAHARRHLARQLERLRNGERRAYDAHLRRERSRRLFLLNRRARVSGKAEALSLRPRHSATFSIRRIESSHASITIPDRHQVSCTKVMAAWKTLLQMGVHQPDDVRVLQLQRLFSKYACPKDLPPLPRHPPSDGMHCFLHATTRKAWRNSLADMIGQKEKSGREPTYAQNFAVLLGVWIDHQKQTRLLLHHGGDAQGYTALKQSAAPRPTEQGFDAASFMRFAQCFIDSGEAFAAERMQRVPQWIRAELHYFLGISLLVSSEMVTPAVTVGKDTCGRRDAPHQLLADPAVRGVLHLQESLSAGSSHAAGALATLREHGLYSHQHSKAGMTLLLQSMKHSSTHLLRELLLRRPHVGSASPPSPRNSVPVDTSRLLRFEQFYAVDHTFSEVDDPFMSRQAVATLVAMSNENVQGSENEPELDDVYREAEVTRADSSYEGGRTGRLQRRLIKANMLLSGFKGVQRNKRDAQCELLVVLRRLGYLCDLDLRPLFATAGGTVIKDATQGSASLRLRTIIGTPLPGTCEEHDVELLDVVNDDRHTILNCPAGAVGPSRSGRRHLDFPNSEELYLILQRTLLSLSYLHLLHTHIYELSHLYASLSIEVALRIPARVIAQSNQTIYASRTPHGVEQEEGEGNSINSDVESSVAALQRIANEDIGLAWAAEAMLEQISNAQNRPAHVGNASKGIDEVRGRCCRVGDSPFVSTEALMLLAVSRWAQRGPLSGNATDASMFELSLAEWTMEPFTVLQKLLSPPRFPTYGAKVATPRSAEHPSVADSTLHPVLDVHTLFLLCLTAMKRWKQDYALVHALDATSFSVHRTDPFVLSSFLLGLRDDETGAPLISIGKVRDVAFAASPHFFGGGPPFLPSEDDTVESYAARLLRFAARHIHSLEPSVELLRSGSYGDMAGLPKGSAGQVLSGARGREALEDDPPRQSRLRMLRRAKQHTMESADVQPLLFAADVHDYLNRSRWTSCGTILHTLYNALLYPFTSTMSEKLLIDMESHMEFERVEDRDTAHVDREGDTGRGGEAFTSTSDTKAKNRDNQTAVRTSVSAFMELFAEDGLFREYFIAGQLLGVTLESGMPEGFSLVLLEAMDRGNRFLSTVAQHLATSVFGPWVANVWTEHHLVSQWHREKKKTLVGNGPIFALESRTPFRFASDEGRQELFARIGRWNAAQALQGCHADNGVDTRRDGEQVRLALDQLLWCAGFLTRRVYAEAKWIYPLAYEAAVFPAADLQCVADLNRLLGELGRPGLGDGNAHLLRAWRRSHENATALLRDLADRLAHAYNLVGEAPAPRLPSSEWEFSRNASGLDQKLGAASRDGLYTSWFGSKSTQLVEPWNRLTVDYSDRSLSCGEGSFYNERLHRVSGYRWGAVVQSWWLRLRHIFLL